MDEQDFLGLLSHALQPAPGVGRWYGGATLLGSLRGVGAELAAWTPAGLRNSIWRLTLHCAYWEWYVARKFEEGGSRERFPRKGYSWPELPDVIDDKTWLADRALARDQHRRLVRAVGGWEPGRLGEKATEHMTYAGFLLGAAMHNAHHTAQIQVLKRLWAGAHPAETKSSQG